MILAVTKAGIAMWLLLFTFNVGWLIVELVGKWKKRR
jgi:hypothetical protein